MKEEELRKHFIQNFWIFTEAYFGAKNNSDPTIFSCLELMQHKFSHLALTEINEAARQYCAGNLGITITPYNGIFTASMFGDLLTAYCKRRDKIKAAIIEEQNQQAQQSKELEESQRKEIEFQQMAKDWLIQHKGNHTFKRWIDLPYGICLALTDMENVNIELRNECFKIAKDELENEKRSHLEDGNLAAYRQLNNLIERVNDGNQTAKQELIARAKSIYPRINVWRLINE